MRVESNQACLVLRKDAHVPTDSIFLYFFRTSIIVQANRKTLRNEARSGKSLLSSEETSDSRDWHTTLAWPVSVYLIFYWVAVCILENALFSPLSLTRSLYLLRWEGWWPPFYDAYIHSAYEAKHHFPHHFVLTTGLSFTGNAYSPIRLSSCRDPSRDWHLWASDFN